MRDAIDFDIVRRVKLGDVNAFGELVGRYQDKVYRIALRYVGNPEDAIDISQDVFVKAYSGLPQFRMRSAFYTWLFRIAVNTSTDFLRSRREGALSLEHILETTSVEPSASKECQPPPAKAGGLSLTSED